MRGLQCVLLIVLTEAKKVKEQPKPYSDAVNAVLMKKFDPTATLTKMPVPFGHIFKEGFGDIDSELKAPLDLVELSMRYPKSPEEERELLKKTRPDLIEFRKTPSTIYLSPRDKFMAELGISANNPINETKFRWYDLSELQARNLEAPAQPRLRTEFGRPKDLPPPPAHMLNVGNLTFPQEQADLTNVTTCDEFGGATFYPKDIVNLDWVPFYAWAYENYSYLPVHKFHFATKKLVNKYRLHYWKRHKSINWDQPKMVMRGITETMLVAVNRKGLFHGMSLPEGVPAVPDENMPLAYFTLRFKIKEPYLAFMYCNQLFATIMAVAGNGPTTNEQKRAEAKILGYRGYGGPVSRDFYAEQVKAGAEKLRSRQKEETKLNKEDMPMESKDE
ncbi:uncharacterized protein LOC142981881 [Anticarsia gemmatalis]|uniref:uncharacterized protein LOC142981881 n=1 Tax=Anticarsia gemmatalis TaxID=129554 RepID=UPI003F765D60